MVPLHQMVHGGHGLLPCPKVWCYLALLTDLELLDHPGQHGSLSNLSSSSDHVVEAPKAFSGGPGCSCSDGKHHRIPPQHYTINWKQQVWTIEFHQFTRFRRSAFETGAATPAQGAPGVPWQPQLQQGIQRKKWMVQLKKCFISSEPHLGKLFCHNFWPSIWKYMWHISSDALFWHFIWHPILAFYLASILTSYLASFLASTLRFLWCSFWPSIWHSIWHSLQAFYLTYLLTFSANFISHIFRRSFWCSIWHSFWHSFWHSIWHCYLASILTFSLACVEVRQCPLRSAARPAAPTEIWSSRLRSGSAHWVLELAVGAQQCPLRSGARSWGRRRKEQEGGKQLW